MSAVVQHHDKETRADSALKIILEPGHPMKIGIAQTKDTSYPRKRVAVRNIFVMPAKAGIQRLKPLDSGQKHAGMTVVDKLSRFKPRDNKTNRKPGLISSIRRSGCYCSGEQCAEADNC